MAFNPRNRQTLDHEQSLRKLLKENPYSSEVLGALAENLLLQRKNPVEARDYAERSLDIDPDQPRLTLKLAHSYYASEHYIEAAIKYAHFVNFEKSPIFGDVGLDFSKGYAALGNSLRFLGFEWSALDNYSKALDKNPDNEDLKNFLDQEVDKLAIKYHYSV